MDSLYTSFWQAGPWRRQLCLQALPSFEDCNLRDWWRLEWGISGHPRTWRVWGPLLRHRLIDDWNRCSWQCEKILELELTSPWQIYWCLVGYGILEANAERFLGVCWNRVVLSIITWLGNTVGSLGVWHTESGLHFEAPGWMDLFLVSYRPAKCIWVNPVSRLPTDAVRSQLWFNWVYEWNFKGGGNRKCWVFAVL